MKILILPPIANRELFSDIYDKVQNTINTPVETLDTIQCSCDGVYICENGNPVRTQSKVFMGARRLNEIKESDVSPADVTKAKAKGSTCKKKTVSKTLTTLRHQACNELEKIIKTEKLEVDGDVLESLKKAIVNDKTGQPITVNFEVQDGDGINYDYDFLDYGFITEHKIHPRSGIEQSDIDAELQKRHCDYGNGMSTYEFNGKPCTILVLQEGQDVTPAQFNDLADQMERIT